MPKAIKILLIVFLIKEILLSAIVPIWHTPDEQAHFAQVAYLAELNSFPEGKPDLNKEILESEKLLGTERDRFGVNKFTYHPEYKIEYTNTLDGKYENQIKSLPISYRKEMVKYEAANYPPLYYWLAAVPYKIFYNSDLFFRVYAARFISIITGLLTVYVAWLIGKEIFERKKLLQITLPILLAFQPMFSFVSVGVTSDNLMNLLFTVILWICILIIKRGVNRKIIVGILVSLIGLYLTKPQFILAFPLIGFSLLIWFVRNEKISVKTKSMSAGVGLLGLIAVILISANPQTYYLLERIYPQSFFPGESKYNINVLSFVKDTLTRTARETVPWYWGVFNWLGVGLPIEILRVINRVLIILGLGIFIRLVIAAKNRREEDYIFVFLFISAITYYIGIVVYNYLFFTSHNFSFGLQGRYFFPVITAHMALLIYGLVTLIPSRFLRLQEWGVKVLVLSMIVLNLIVLGILVNSYYDWSSINILVNQMSQYKPFYFKGGWIILWVALAITLLVIFIYQYAKIKNEKSLK